MTPAEKSSWILDRALSLGLDLCGFVVLDDGVLAELARLPEWLERGYAGEMKYLHDPRRADPRLVLEEARSLIVVAMNYYSEPTDVSSSTGTLTDGTPRGWISRYAWGSDYHEVIGQKLQTLIDEMRRGFTEPFEARAYVDTGPLLERVAAKYAGLGWLAKNTLLINSKLGSWLFLGVIITTLDLEPTLAPGESPAADFCGSCTRCLDACPTQAFPQPYVLDARRCISYLTIELRGSIPEELRPQVGNAVIGCDICQDVCPWNRRAPLTRVPAFEARASLFSPDLERLASLSQEDFSGLFRGSAGKRAKWRGVVRNACVALGNSSVTKDDPAYDRVIRLLNRLALSDDSIVAEHAQWALRELSNSTEMPEQQVSRRSAAERKTP